MSDFGNLVSGTLQMKLFRCFCDVRTDELFFCIREVGEVIDSIETAPTPSLSFNVSVHELGEEEHVHSIEEGFRADLKKDSPERSTGDFSGSLRTFVVIRRSSNRETK